MVAKILPEANVLRVIESIASTVEWFNNNSQPDVILMDLRMPVLDGYEATERIRSLMENDPAVVDTKVIALTASAFEENKARAFESGCNDFVRKPFRESEIFKIMNTQLGARFIYAEEAELAAPRSSDEQISFDDIKAMVAALPPDIISRLAQAADSCDADRIDRIIDEIEGHSRELANILSRFSRKFDYDRIMQLINSS